MNLSEFLMFLLLFVCNSTNLYLSIDIIVLNLCPSVMNPVKWGEGLKPPSPDIATPMHVINKHGAREHSPSLKTPFCENLYSHIKYSYCDKIETFIIRTLKPFLIFFKNLLKF